MKKQKGFTLIELLVVIAIIGILSSIVLASLNSARDKGQDASASASISSVRAEAELLFDDEGDYDTVCQDGTDTIALVSAAVNANGQTAHCEDETGNWAASIVLQGGFSNFCADATGFAGKTNNTQAGVSCVQ